MHVGVDRRVSSFNGCVFCEVQLCLVSCICEYGCSVPSYLKQFLTLINIWQPAQ